jgi:Uma2 family endonuclease
MLLKRHGQDWAPVPDITYISYERLPVSWKRNEACPVPPELAGEIMSLAQTIKEFEDKAKDYFEAGVLRVWVVDPETISIRVFSPDKTSQYTDSTPIIDSLFPGLELTPKQVFEEAELL